MDCQKSSEGLASLKNSCEGSLVVSAGQEPALQPRFQLFRKHSKSSTISDRVKQATARCVKRSLLGLAMYGLAAGACLGQDVGTAFDSTWRGHSVVATPSNGNYLSMGGPVTSIGGSTTVGIGSSSLLDLLDNEWTQSVTIENGTTYIGSSDLNQSNLLGQTLTLNANIVLPYAYQLSGKLLKAGKTTRVGSATFIGIKGVSFDKTGNIAYTSTTSIPISSVLTVEIGQYVGNPKTWKSLDSASTTVTTNGVASLTLSVEWDFASGVKYTVRGTAVDPLDGTTTNEQSYIAK